MKNNELLELKKLLDEFSVMLFNPSTTNDALVRRLSDINDSISYMLKPCTKDEFVKCEFNHAWEAVKTFEDGEELYTKRSHKDFVLIDNAPDVLRFLYDLHCKVETEIDERQEFIDECMLTGGLRARDGAVEVYGKLYDSGEFKLVEK